VQPPIADTDQQQQRRGRHQELTERDPYNTDRNRAYDEIYTALTNEETKMLRYMREKFDFLKENQKLLPCRIDDDCQLKTKRSLGIFSLFVRSTSKAPKVLLHNTLPFHRHICGKIIWGSGGILELVGSDIDRCLSTGLPYVNTPRPPPVSGEGLRPIELYWDYSDLGYLDDGLDGFYGDIRPQTEAFPCPIACRKAEQSSIVSVISVKDTSLEIMSTMEGEQYYAEAAVMPKSYRQHQFYATTSFRSEIPMPYFSWAEYDIQHSSVNFDKAIKGASFLAKNCFADNGREDVVLALMEESKLRVDSLSECHHNAEPPPGVNMDNKTAVQEKYLFHLAFENQNAEDYITEKLWGALAAGTLPVYLGAPNVKDHVPPNSIIVVDDFPSTKDLADYLIRLTKDKALYESYHTWRYQPIDPHFKKKFHFTNTHSTCRICKWAHSIKHGFRWDHGHQEVSDPYIPHDTCRNKMGLISHPFKEYWSAAVGDRSIPVHSDVNVKTCSLDLTNRILEIDGGICRRMVYDQDGITDLIVECSVPRVYELKLETTIKSDNLQSINDDLGQEWRLQDDKSRLTFLFNLPTTKPTIVQPGIVRVIVNSSVRIRVIVEDLDIFHKGAKKHRSYFGDVMKRDFFTPIEAYTVLRSK